MLINRHFNTEWDFQLFNISKLKPFNLRGNMTQVNSTLTGQIIHLVAVRMFYKMIKTPYVINYQKDVFSLTWKMSCRRKRL